MSMSKQIFKTVGITEADYRNWCKEHKKPIHDTANRTDFFQRVLDGRIVKDSKTGKLISKRRSKQ